MAAVEELKKAKDKGDVQGINEKIKKVSEVSQRLGQAVYQETAKKQAEEQAKSGAGEQTTEKPKSSEEKKGGEDVSDAEYKVE